MRIGVVAAALVAVVLWGASPVAAKVAVSSMPVLAVVFLRTVLGGVAALPVALLLRVPFPQSSQHRALLLLSGFCGFVGFPLLFTLGVERTSANHASMILACLPIFTGAIAMMWDRRRPKFLWWAGCAVAFAGEFLLISNYSDDVGTGAPTVFGDGLILVSNLFASLGYVAGGRLQRDGYPATGTTFWGVILFGVLLLPCAPFFLSGVDFGGVPRDAWFAVLYLAVGVTIVGYMLWYWSLGRGGIERVGLFQFLQPVSGVILAWVLLGEHLTSGFMLASAVILVGVGLALKAK